MLELEKTYLAKCLPDDLPSTYEEVLDIYIPADREHPKLRLRKKNQFYTLTKKFIVNSGDASQQIEQSIELDEDEYNVLARIGGSSLRKRRYKYKYKGLIAEIDLFLDTLKGLVLVDFEFQKRAEQKAFEKPDFCLVDVTQEDFIAGGMLAGNNYKDIVDDLKRFGYRKLDYGILTKK